MLTSERVGGRVFISSTRPHRDISAVESGRGQLCYYGFFERGWERSGVDGVTYGFGTALEVRGVNHKRVLQIAGLWV